MNTAYAEDLPVGYVDKKKIKKPGFIDRWLFKKLQNGAAFEQSQQNEKVSNMKLSAGIAIDRSGPSIDQPERAIQFTVYQANGGRVIETRRYDRQKDRHANGLYVITSDMDFGKEIDKIITMEHLKS
jgi:hypothetical protein